MGKKNKMVSNDFTLEKHKNLIILLKVIFSSILFLCTKNIFPFSVDFYSRKVKGNQ